MYPDIIMITEASVGVSSNTLCSIVRHAPRSICLVKPNSGIDRQAGDYIQEKRLEVLRKSNSEYVLIMDDDDELISNVPVSSELEPHDVVFFKYKQDNKVIRSFLTCRPAQIFVFCGVILKREIAIKALEYTIEKRFLREDIGFFYFIIKNIRNIYFSNKILINKIGQREPKRSLWLKNGFRNEVETIWRSKINTIRQG